MPYPFTPKSALKLQLGDYWSVRRTDGLFAFFVYIGRWGDLRSGFTAALLDHVQPSPHLAGDGPRLHVLEAAHLHVKTFPETSSEIAGNIGQRLEAAEIEHALEEQQEKSRVWGYRVPLAKAEKPQTNIA
jgi:hypothetical protein